MINQSARALCFSEIQQANINLKHPIPIYALMLAIHFCQIFCHSFNTFEHYTYTTRIYYLNMFFFLSVGEMSINQLI